MGMKTRMVAKVAPAGAERQGAAVLRFRKVRTPAAVFDDRPFTASASIRG
jgi:hypothetical protein